MLLCQIRAFNLLLCKWSAGLKQCILRALLGYILRIHSFANLLCSLSSLPISCTHKMQTWLPSSNIRLLVLATIFWPCFKSCVTSQHYCGRKSCVWLQGLAQKPLPSSLQPSFCNQLPYKECCYFSLHVQMATHSLKHGHYVLGAWWGYSSAFLCSFWRVDGCKNSHFDSDFERGEAAVKIGAGTDFLFLWVPTPPRRLRTIHLIGYGCSCFGAEHPWFSLQHL